MSNTAAGLSPDPFFGNSVNDLMAFEASLRNDQPGTSAQADQPSTSVVTEEEQKMEEDVQEKKERVEELTEEEIKVLREEYEDQRRITLKMVLPANIDELRYNPGRFLWLWFLGIQMPGIALDGEPHIPLELLQELMTPQEAGDLDTKIREYNIYTRVCDSMQHTTIREKCKEKEKLKDLDLVNQFTTLTLVARSDLHCIMGSLRKEGSRKTKCEHDVWNIAERVEVVHFNFADLFDETESSDSEDLCLYDYTNNGCVGYWYKGRNNMRCIECAKEDCKQKFTPNDFVIHDCRMKDKKITGQVTHVGLDPNNWPRMIMIKDKHDKENIEAWKKFSMKCQAPGKRAYDDAEPQAPPPKRIALENGVSEDDEEDIEIDVEEIQDEMECDDDVDEEKEREVYDCDNRMLYAVNVRGPTGMTTKMCTAEECFEMICKTMAKKFTDEQLEAILRSDSDTVDIWYKDLDFKQKVLKQAEDWQKIREHPKFVCKATSHFDEKQNKFVNLQFFHSASKEVKMEIQKLAEEMRELNENKDFLKDGRKVEDRWKKEQELLKNLSEEAMRVLNNVPPPPPPPPPPMPKPKAIPPVVTPVPITPITPISFPNINFAQIAQQLAQQLAGGKLPLPPVTFSNIPVPQVSPVVTSPVNAAAAFTPSAPSTPVLPQTPVLPSVLPLLPNPELLKAQLALASPHLLPLLYPTAQFKLPTFEQITQFLKTTTVKN